MPVNKKPVNSWPKLKGSDIIGFNINGSVDTDECLAKRILSILKL